MSLEEPDALDAITENPDGTPILVVVEDCQWADDDDRWSKLL